MFHTEEEEKKVRYFLLIYKTYTSFYLYAIHFSPPKKKKKKDASYSQNSKDFCLSGLKFINSLSIAQVDDLASIRR